MTAPLLRPLGFGEILDGAFTIYRRHFVVLFATALIVLMPMSLASWSVVRAMAATTPGEPPDVAALMGFVFLFLPVTMLGYLLLSAALTRQTACAIVGRGVSLGDGYGKAGRRLLSLVGAMLLIGLATVATSLVLALVGGLGIAMVALVTALTAGATGDAVMPAAIAAAGTIVVMVASGLSMLVLMAMFFAVVPAVVLEGSGPAAALGRSWRLSRGARLKITGILIVAWLIITLPTVGLTIATGATTGSFLPDPGAGLPMAQLLAQQVIGLISGALTFPFFIGCLTLLYFDRRVRTEAYDLEAAADALPAGG